MLVYVGFIFLTFAGSVLGGNKPKCNKPEHTCPKNEHYTRNNPRCIRTCANKWVPTSDDCKPFTGCVCNDGFVRLNDDASGRCVPEHKCPNKCKDPNAIYKKCPNPCPLTCDSPFPRVCNKMCLANGCECAPGFLQDSDGKCIRPKDCPKPITCPKHSRYVMDDNQCPKTCGNRCLPNSDAAGACAPFTGCVCKPGYVRKYDNATGPCIKETKCLPIPTECGVNEVATSCAVVCPPQTCDSMLARYICHPTECKPGCDCRNGHLRNDSGVCIKSENCFNEHPAGCGGDLNATRARDCGNPNPPTCENPEPEVNNNVCVINGCQCKQEYIMGDHGKCIAPSDCPGGSPKCGENKTYVGCKFGCPTNYCPRDDSRAQVACSMPFPCQGGCACKAGYLIVSPEDPRCVLASECPEVECTRPNEVWDPNPSGCFLERCEDRGSKCDYPYPSGPRCVCAEGHHRTEDDVCVPDSECPPLACKGDYNATLTVCPNPCPKTCDDPEAGDGGCIEICLETDCQCNDGYFLTKIGGICIKPEDCGSCKGDPHAYYSNCPSACEPTCEKPDRNRACTRQCMPPGCVCRDGYVLNTRTGKCVKPKSCPVPGCNGDPNAEHKECPSACEPTCANPNPAFCTKQCMPPGCVCKKGFVLNEDTGLCVELEKCPVIGCDGDYNAEYSKCPSACPRTCTNPNPEFCTKQCMPPGCVCKKGFVLNEDTGLCVELDKCPAPGCNGDANAEYSECPSACAPTCTNSDPQICTFQCMPPGCVCKFGFYLNEATGKCVELENCPADPRCDGDRNATYKQSSSYCQATCKNPDTEGECMDMPMPPGCVCKNGFIRRKTGGKCIRPEDCPGGWPTCRQNETYVFCKAGCPTDYCPVDDSLDMVACDPPYPCPGGCVCQRGHLIASVDDERCILSSECPRVTCTRPNEEWDPYAPGCLHERCDDKDIPCDFQFPGPPRCRCKKGYYRNQDQICVPECQCPKPGCNGDLNATFSDCPSKCPATCCKPDSDRICTTDCDEPGCVCNEGFIQSYPGGPCISPYDCKGGSPHCSENMTYTSCKIDCPMKYCPQDENEVMVICDPIWPCPTGCECKHGFLKPNTGENKCILAADCPPVECTRPNEVWDPSPSICNYERCDEMYYECSDPTPGRPKCVCKPGFYRDNNGVCIPAAECPCQIADECKRTCAEPNPPNCAYNPPQENIDGCDCKDGYILSELGGKCIPIDQCPPEVACRGDPNARPKRCPKPCPSTCESPNQFPCKRMCEAIGCECKSGFMLSNNTETARCILPDKCPGGNPCGKSGRFVDCKTDCKYDYCPVDDSRDLVFCDPPAGDCLSGCICNLNHKRKSRDDPRCIVSSKCPPVNCTRPNEIWNSCPSACLAENCEDIKNQPITCNTLVLNCEPRCICKDNHFRNSKGICVCAEDCPPPGCGGDPNAMYSECPSACEPTCTNQDPQICTEQCLPPGCICKPGLVLNEDTGKCVEREDCPVPVCEDPHAVYKQCPSACEPTCADPEPEVCTDQCMPPSCVCKEGYVLNEKDGKCVKKCHCPGN